MRVRPEFEPGAPNRLPQSPPANRWRKAVTSSRRLDAVEPRCIRLARVREGRWAGGCSVFCHGREQRAGVPAHLDRRRDRLASWWQFTRSPWWLSWRIISPSREYAHNSAAPGGHRHQAGKKFGYRSAKLTSNSRFHGSDQSFQTRTLRPESSKNAKLMPLVWRSVAIRGPGFCLDLRQCGQ